MKGKTMPAKQKITPCLWFNGNAAEAMDFYMSIFEDSKILSTTNWGKEGGSKEGSLLVATFQLVGQEYIALNGGPEFQFSEGISLSIACETQEEVDRLTEKLTADGGQVRPCSWVKDKFGLSWQIVPTILPEMLRDKDQAKADRVMAAMMKMYKIDIQKIKDAYNEA
jgi:predicted 3-demethylubiquinone-9 3-methyltransferase (glyoxalase superfamily)